MDKYKTLVDLFQQNKRYQKMATGPAKRSRSLLLGCLRLRKLLPWRQLSKTDPGLGLDLLSK